MSKTEDETLDPKRLDAIEEAVAELVEQVRGLLADLQERDPERFGDLKFGSS